MHEFLESVERFNSQYASVEINGELDSLSYSFWSVSEIENGKKLQVDWDVPAHLIPFYGDWHDLFCLDSDGGQIVSLNDVREIVHAWGCIDDFIASLSEAEVELTKKPEIVNFSLSPDLLKKANEFKKKNT
ncbi:MAG: cell wall assembly protein [Gammaproteobacteria bacterium]|nr:cell wall assembly protein [Gammaproteobacteria bacterium]